MWVRVFSLAELPNVRVVAVSIGEPPLPMLRLRNEEDDLELSTLAFVSYLSWDLRRCNDLRVVGVTASF